MTIFNKNKKTGSFGFASCKAMADAIVSQIPTDSCIEKVELSKMGKGPDDKAGFFLNFYLKDDFVQDTATGRLLRLDSDGTLTVVLDGLRFANGVALAADESFVAVAECRGRTVVRLWLTGPRAGQRDHLVTDLPGYPDNISRGSDGLIWVAVASPVDPLVERFGVLSFPVGKIFHRGRLVGDFMGGSLAHEIVTEMLTIRDDLRRAEETTEAEADDSAPAKKDEL